MNRSEREQHFLDEIARRDKELARLRAENELLRERVDLLIRKIYGPSSEKIDPGQLGLLLDAEAAKKSDAGGGDEAAPAAEEKAAPRRKQRERCRPGLPKDIEVEEVIVDPEEVRADPEAYDYLGREVSERLEYDPERYRLRRTIRRTWVKRGEADRKPMTAPLEPCLLEGSLLSPSLAAHLLTDKFCDHLPFYRQEQILERHHDIRIGRNTMCHWAAVCAQWLEPLYKRLKHEIRRQDCLLIDETPIDYLCPGNGKTKRGYLWTYYHPEVGVIYDWRPSRSHQSLSEVLVDASTGVCFSGIVVCDGFQAYETWQKKHPGVILAACWAHVRRKFHEANAHHPQQAGPILELVGRLFQIERGLREQRAGPDRRRRVRQEQSRPIVEEIKHRLATLGPCLPKSTLGKARDYTLGLWERLLVFLEHGQVPIDNNLVENAIRPTKLGSKNWMFIGGVDTGDRTAIIYTMVENIRQGGGDPYAYLKDLFERLPAMTNQDDLTPLLPRHWLEARRKDAADREAA